MNNNEILGETLNDLVKINNDRTAGYEKAAAQTDYVDLDLQAIFHKMANDSKKNVTDLNEKIASLGEGSTAETSASGKIHRMWMDVKNVFTGSDRESILSSCEFGEDAAQKAYNEALHTEGEMSAETRQLIMDQKDSLKTSHDLIKKYRDMHVAVNH